MIVTAFSPARDATPSHTGHTPQRRGASEDADAEDRESADTTSSCFAIRRMLVRILRIPYLYFHPRAQIPLRKNKESLTSCVDSFALCRARCSRVKGFSFPPAASTAPFSTASKASPRIVGDVFGFRLHDATASPNKDSIS